MAYIDTSVLVAYYCPEPLSKRAERAIRGASLPAISPLAEVEFCSAMAIKTRTGEADADTAQRVISQLLGHCAAGYYRILPISYQEYALACEWISQFSVPLRANDALHLAVASSHELKLVTADKAMARAAKDFGVKYSLLS